MHIDSIVKYFSNDQGKPALVSGITMEREQMFGSLHAPPVIIVLTDRSLTLNGGDGFHGIDSIDMANISGAVRLALKEDGGSGYVSKVIVRERRHYPKGDYTTI